MNESFILQIILLRITLLFIILLFIKEFKTIIKHFIDINKKSWWILLFILIFGYLLRTFYSPFNYFHENWHGYEYVENAIYLNGFHQYGSSYYTFYNLFFFLLPKNETTIFLINSIIGSFSILLLFLLTFSLLKNEIISLYSSLILCTFPIYIRLSTSESFFVLAVFFVLLTLISFLLYIETNNIFIFILSMFLLNFTIQIRPFLIFIIFPILLLFVLYDKKIISKLKNYRIWLLLVLFFILLLKHFVFQLDLIINNKQPQVYTFDIRTILKYTINKNFNLILNANYFPPIILIFVIIGILYFIINKKKVILFLLPFILLFMYLYISISSCTPAKIRMQSFYMFVLFIIAGSGIFELSKIIINKNIKKIYHITVIAIFLFIPFIYYTFITKLYNPQIEFNFIKNNIKYLPEKSILIINDHSIRKYISSYFPYWLLKENKKEIKVIRLNDFKKNEGVLKKYDNVIIYQGVSFFSFHDSELLALGFNKETLNKNNSTKNTFEKKTLTDLKNEFYFSIIKEITFKNNPYGFEIVPQKELIIGFYKLNNKNNDNEFY